jgi:transcription termination/antitermination protein NusG
MGQWYAIRTNIKCEHKALRELRLAGFETYMPEFKIERHNRRKRVNIVTTLILFPRYLFLRQGPLPDWYSVRRCNGVESVLGIDGTPIAIPAKAIADLQKAQANLDWDDTEEAKRRRGITKKNMFKTQRETLEGAKVLITEGPFKSFEGMVSNVTAIDRLNVEISVFGRPTPIALELAQVRVLDEAKAAA